MAMKTPPPPAGSPPPPKAKSPAPSSEAVKSPPEFIWTETDPAEDAATATTVTDATTTTAATDDTAVEPPAHQPTAAAQGTSQGTSQQNQSSTAHGTNLQTLTSYRPSKRVDFVCPYCMREIYTGDLLYVCRRCKTAYTEAEAREKGLGRVVKKQYYCCNDNITSSRICPNCKIHAENNNITLENLRLLPQDVYKAKNEFRVCMTGYSSSGKTQYITRLMDYIVKYSLPDIDSTYFLDNKTQDIRNAIHNKFFIDGKIAGNPSGYLEPLLFDIKRGKNSYVSVFYDIAGEDFRENRDTLATRCIWTSDNIILLIDPTSLPGVQDHPRVKEFIGKGIATLGEVIEPLNTFTMFVAKNREQGTKAFKKINLAIVFSKMDLFYEDDDLPDVLKVESKHIVNNHFDYNAVTEVSDAMKHWIRLKEGDAILRALNQYPNVQIFGVSSGSEDLSVKSDTKHLLDPYLWLLYQNRILR